MKILFVLALRLAQNFSLWPPWPSPLPAQSLACPWGTAAYAELSRCARQQSWALSPQEATGRWYWGCDKGKKKLSQFIPLRFSDFRKCQNWTSTLLWIWPRDLKLQEHTFLFRCRWKLTRITTLMGFLPRSGRNLEHATRFVETLTFLFKISRGYFPE